MPDDAALLELSLLGISIKDDSTVTAVKIRDSIKGIMDAAVELEQTVQTKAKSFWEFFTGKTPQAENLAAKVKLTEHTVRSSLEGSFTGEDYVRWAEEASKRYETVTGAKGATATVAKKTSTTSTPVVSGTVKTEAVAAGATVEKTKDLIPESVTTKTKAAIGGIRKEVEAVWEKVEQVGKSILKWVVGLAAAYLSFRAIKDLAQEIWELGKVNEEIWTKFAGIVGSSALASQLNDMVESMGLLFPTEKAETFQNILSQIETQGFGAVNMTVQKMRSLISAAAGEGKNLQEVFDQAYSIAYGNLQNMEPFFNNFRAILNPDELQSKLSQAAPGYLGFWERMNILTEEFTRAYPGRVEMLNATVKSQWTSLGRHIDSIKLAIMGAPVAGTFYYAIRETITKVVDFIEKNTPRIRALAAQIGQFFKAIWGYVDDLVSSVLNAGQRMLGGTAETMNLWIKQQVLPVLTWLILWTGKIKFFAESFLEGFKKPFVWFWEATKPLREGIGYLIDKIFDSGEKAGEATEKFNAWRRAFEILGTVVGSLVLLKGLQLLASAIGSIVSLSPVTLVIAGITLALWGLYEAWDHDWMGLRTAFVDSFKGIGDEVSRSFDFLKDLKISFEFKDLEPALKGVIVGIAEYFASIVKMALGATEVVASFYEILSNPFDKKIISSARLEALKGLELFSKGVYGFTIGSVVEGVKAINEAVDKQVEAARAALPGFGDVEAWRSIKSQLGAGASTVQWTPQEAPLMVAPTETYIPPQVRDFNKLIPSTYREILDYRLEHQKPESKEETKISYQFIVQPGAIQTEARTAVELAADLRRYQLTEATRRGIPSPGLAFG